VMGTWCAGNHQVTTPHGLHGFFRPEVPDVIYEAAKSKWRTVIAAAGVTGLLTCIGFFLAGFGYPEHFWWFVVFCVPVGVIAGALMGLLALLLITAPHPFFEGLAVLCLAAGVGLFVFGRSIAPVAPGTVLQEPASGVMRSSMFQAIGAGIFTLGFVVLALWLLWRFRANTEGTREALAEGAGGPIRETAGEAPGRSNG